MNNHKIIFQKFYFRKNMMLNH